jgi:hypothetical protein
MIGIAGEVKQHPAVRYLDPYSLHIAQVKADQKYGILLGDGVAIASIENRWVRKALRSQGKLYRRQRPIINQLHH